MIQSIWRKPLTATLLLYDEMHNIKNPDKVYIYKCYKVLGYM